ncbi:MAG TPA: hypothetical protein DCM59_14935 [Clostridium sp.]|jgi:hypothetical protein|uniref:hypothetical protein n=1 Tax=unclassified Clostridium TaxID=2614128 RepID=UPI000EC9126F|nr:hypothetical protein [Clostridium sp.]
MGKKKNRKTNKEILQEAHAEGMFIEAEEMAKGKKKYEFRSGFDTILSVIIVIIALLIISFVRRYFNL